jgi:hypothetical protein
MLLLLLSPFILPIRATGTLDSSSNSPYLNFQKLPENTTIIPSGNSTLIIKDLPNNCFKATFVSADGKNTTIEVVNRKISNQTSIQENTNPNSVLTERVVLVNGQEACKLPINDRIIPPSSGTLIKQNMLLDSVTYYWWDNVYFGQGDPLFQYPHPDRTHYSIPTYANWVRAGNNLWHFQFSDAESGFLAGAGAAVFAGEVGALIIAGTLGFPLAGALIDAFVVPLIYAAIYAFEESTILDEESCLWFLDQSILLELVVSESMVSSFLG